MVWKMVHFPGKLSISGRECTISGGKCTILDGKMVRPVGENGLCLLGKMFWKMIWEMIWKMVCGARTVPELGPLRADQSLGNVAKPPPSAND